MSAPKPLKPSTVAWLSNIRAEAEAPGALAVLIRGPRGSVAIFREDVIGRSDHELLAFIAGRLMAD